MLDPGCLTLPPRHWWQRIWPPSQRRQETMPTNAKKHH
jgi:hypothetical protein